MQSKLLFIMPLLLLLAGLQMNAQNVGIGTTTPKRTFVVRNDSTSANTVVAELASSSGDKNYHLVTTKGDVLNNSGAVVTKIGLLYGDANANHNTYLRFHRGNGIVGGFLSFSTDTDMERMRIDAIGNVGIGTAAPAQKLQVQVDNNGFNIPLLIQNLNGTQNGATANGNNSVGIGFLNESGGNWYKAAITHERTGAFGIGKLHFLVNGTADANPATFADTRMTVTSAGVGIGTTNPQGELHVKSAQIQPEAIDQQHTVTNVAVGGVLNWQSFTAGATGVLTKLDLMLNSPVSAPSSGTIKIYSGEGIGGILLSTTDVTFQQVLGNTYQTFVLGSGTNIVAGNVYTMVYTVPAATTGWVSARNSNGYAGGRCSADANWDYIFKTFVVQTIFQDAIIAKNGNVGIGVATPTSKLEVLGSTKTTTLQLTNGAVNGYILKSDGSGNASWSNLNAVETDPKVGSAIANKIPKWNGAQLVDGLVLDNGTNLGIGSIDAGAKLNVPGNTKTTNLQMPTGAVNGYILKTDNSGNASWVSPASVETDPKIGSISTNQLAMWNGTALVGSAIYDDGNTAGVNGIAADATFFVNGSLKATNLRMTQGATSGYVLKCDALGYGTWSPVSSLNIPESDPKVGSSINNRLARWNVSADKLLDGAMIDNGSSAGLGSIDPVARFNVDGKTRTTTFQMTQSPTNGYFLKCDADGDASWAAEADPKFGGSLIPNRVLKWSGSVATNSSLYDNGSGLGIGVNSLRTGEKLAINSDGFLQFSVFPGYLDDAVNNSWTTMDMPGAKGLRIWDNMSVDGNMGIGIATATHKLEVIGNVKAGGYLTRKGTSGTYGTSFYNFEWDGGTLTAWVDGVHLFNGLTSDRRLKDRINSLQNTGIGRVMALRPVDFFYKNVPGSIFTGSPKQQEGFIADELQAIIPSAVNGEKDGLTKEGKLQPQTVNVMPIISVLTKAVQEQQLLIEKLQKQVEELLRDKNTGIKK